jgi:hypothetical protein
MRERLAEWVYGDVPDEEAAGFEEHLSECPACRDERAALAHMRQALDAAKAPSPEIRFAKLYGAADERRRRSVRRWRQAALGLAGALAASLLLVVLSNLDVRWEAGELSVRWRSDIATRKEQPPRPSVDETELVKGQMQNFAARLEILSDLVCALATDVADRDRERIASVGVLRQQLDALRESAVRAWADNRRDIEALYAVRYGAAGAEEND